MSENDPLLVVPPSRGGCNAQLSSTSTLDFEHHGGIDNEVIPNTPQDLMNRRSWQQYWESWCPLVSAIILLVVVAWLIVSNPNTSTPNASV